MGGASSTSEFGYDARAGGVVMIIPAPLPVDELLIVKCERLIKKMNRSERQRIHLTLLDARKHAPDKLTTDNSNVASTRLTRSAYASLLNICDAHGVAVSAFVRKVVMKAIKETANETTTNQSL